MIRKSSSQKSRNKKFHLNLIQKLIILLGVTVFVLSTLQAIVILLVGLLPTITVIITNSKNINKITIVGCFNLAGIFFCLMDLLYQINNDGGISLIANIYNIIIMLCFAALGLILYYELPNLFLFISKASAQHRLKNINSKLEKIAEEWGEEAIAQINR